MPPATNKNMKYAVLNLVTLSLNKERSNPCSLCARMRRGILHDMSKNITVTNLR